MTQPSMFDLPESRRKVTKEVPVSSRLAYQAEHARLDARSDQVRAWLCGWLYQVMFSEAADTMPEPTSAELARFAVHVCDEPDTGLLLLMHTRRGLSDLQAAGVVEKAGNRTCRVSGRTCATWRVRTR